MTDDIEQSNGPDDRTEDLLRRFAAARLSPRTATRTRMRTVVMREAHRASSHAPAKWAPLVSSTSVAVPSRDSKRPVLSAFLAAAFVLMLLTGSALGARPGGPLYAVRLWVEAAAMPSTGDARAEAELRRLEARLDEAISAAAAGDARAIRAAAGAYREVVDAALGSAVLDEERAARLEEALHRHLEVLEGLLSKVPDPARAAIEQAIEKSDRAVERIDNLDSDGPGKPGQPNHPNSPPSKAPKSNGQPSETPGGSNGTIQPTDESGG